MEARISSFICCALLVAWDCNGQPYSDPLRHKLVAVEEGDLCAHGAWDLVFEEEFAGEGVDSDRWLTHYPYCFHSDECYESRVHGWPDVLTVNADSNVFVTGDGFLNILARKGDRAFWYGASSVYTSGVLHSRQSFARGRFESRLKVPKSGGKHLWPAFWLFGGGPNCVEIDILEVMARPSSEYHYALHRYNEPCNGKEASESGNRELDDLADDFHVYRVDWDVWFVDFYIDDVLIHRSSRLYDVLNRPVTTCNAPPGIYVQNQAFPAQDAHVSVILSLAVKRRLFTSPAGQDLDIQDLPAAMVVDYVRVYRRR